MIRMLALALLLCTACARVQHGVSAPAAKSLALTNVNIVDVQHGRVLPAQTVLIAGNRIRSVVPSGRGPAPAGAQVVDARDLYLIPGLWDMHVHTLRAGRAPTYFRLFIANGVTGVRDMGAELDSALYWRARLARGAMVGPRLVVAGPFVDARPPQHPALSIAVSSAAEARQTVRALHRVGVDLIKVYHGLSPETYGAVMDEARRRRLPVVGHVPWLVPVAEASEAGQRSVEHTVDVGVSCSALEDELRAARVAMIDSGATPQRLWAARTLHDARAAGHYDAEKCRALMRRFARNRTWQTPTLWLAHMPVALLDDTTIARDPRLRLLDPTTRQVWEETLRSNRRLVEQREQLQRAARFRSQLVGEMVRAGVPLLAGTDLPNLFVMPGFSLHDEMEMLVRAGATPLGALRAATLNPALYLEATDSFGTVEQGKLADLVLLEANPLEDIRNTRKVRAVVLNGRYLDRNALDALLADAERTANAPQP